MTSPSPTMDFLPSACAPAPAGERLARLAVAFLAFLHLAIAASLAIVLLTAGGTAFAQSSSAPRTACGGSNILDRLERSDPTRFAALQDEARDVVNGEGLLWRVENGQSAPSWLFGTMHVSDPRVLLLDQTTQSALDAAATVVIETDEIVDPARTQAAIFARPDLTMFTDGTTLQTLMDADDYERVKAALDEVGIPIAAVSRMKPWMLAAFVALPACELERKADGAAFLDRQIADDALADGKRLMGLETVEEQLSAMASLPIEFHIRGLIETISMGPLLDDIMSTMTDLYLDGDIGMIMPMIRQASPPGSETAADDYADFEERIILQRNRLMVDRAAPILAEGNAFIAVGALHLPGEDGLVELMRDAGYEVTRVD